MTPQEDAQLKITRDPPRGYVMRSRLLRLAKWIPVAVGVGLVLLGLTLDASPKAAENESLGVTI